MVEMRERHVLLVFPLALHEFPPSLTFALRPARLPFTVLSDRNQGERLLHNMFAIILKAGGNVASVKTGRTANIFKKLFFSLPISCYGFKMLHAALRSCWLVNSFSSSFD